MNNINWNVFITKDYWLGIDRAGMALTDNIILYVGIALVALAIIVLVIRLVSSNDLTRATYNRVISVFFSVGLLEMLWYVLRSQFVNALGTRLSALIVGLVGLYFLIQPIKYFLFQYRHDLVNLQKQKLKEKYLQTR